MQNSRNYIFANVSLSLFLSFAYCSIYILSYTSFSNLRYINMSTLE